MRRRDFLFVGAAFVVAAARGRPALGSDGSGGTSESQSPVVGPLGADGAGSLLRAASRQARVAYSGLHAGCAVEVEDSSGRRHGALACLLGRRADSPTHGVTAGHLFEVNANDAVLRAAAPGENPCLCGRLVRNYLDDPPRPACVDAALVELTDDAKALFSATRATAPVFLVGIQDPRQSRSVTALAYRPTAEALTHQLRVELGTRRRMVEAPPKTRRPRYPVEAVLEARAETCDGDSGTVLGVLRARRPGQVGLLALGLCIGGEWPWSLFQPLAAVVREAAKDVGIDPHAVC